MTQIAIRKLLDLIDEIVHEDGNYKDKLNRILEEADERDKTSLEEFIAWFDEVGW